MAEEVISFASPAAGLLHSKRPARTNAGGAFIFTRCNMPMDGNQIRDFLRSQDAIGRQAMAAYQPVPPHEPSKYFVGIDDRALTPDEIEFMQAVEAYKRKTRRPYPTWHEVLAILTTQLGYRKVANDDTQRGETGRT